MAYNVTIDGVNRTTDVVAGSITIDDQINDAASTCSFELFNLSSTGFPETDDEVIITLDDGTIIFGGTIKSVSYKKLSTGGVGVAINCVDYTSLFDSHLVRKSYEDMTDAAIIADIVTTYCAGLGITTTNVVEGVTISQISFNYLQPSQCMRKICEVTGRNWYIDYEKDVHYFPIDTEQAPFDIGATYQKYYIQDDMTTTPEGALEGSAVYDSVNDYVRLTPAANDVTGRLVYEETIPSAFTMTAQLYSGGGTGADANFVFWGCSSAPNAESSATGGFTVALDEYENKLQILYDGVVYDEVEEVDLGYTIDDADWHTLKVITSTSPTTEYTITIEIDDVEIVSSVLPNYPLSGNFFGVGGRTGGLNNEHRCRSFELYSTNQYQDVQDLQIAKDSTQVKNRVYVRGGTKLSDSVIYEEKGDGEKRIFVLPEKPHDVSVEVNSVAKTLGIKNIDTTGYDWYLNFQEKYIEQDSGGVVLGTGDTLTVTYKYDIPILVAQEDTASIVANGVKEFAIFDSNIKTTSAARDRAAAELTDYANDLIEGSFSTFEPGWRAGQTITITESSYGVDDDYIVQRVSLRSFGAGLYRYTISLASAKTMGIIRFLIEMLEANKNEVTLETDEVVDELLQITDLLIGDSLLDSLTIDSAGPYRTWSTGSGSVPTRARWDLFAWK